MDIVERLTLEAAQADTMLACEHRHRYEFAAGLCAGRRVLDLCCGSGYGSAILASSAREVVGVDNNAATVEMAAATIGYEVPGTSFALVDALAFLADALAFQDDDVGSRFEAIVCFEGLEHLQDLDRAFELLREHAQRGVQIVASVPNDKLFDQENPFHVTAFGYDEALAAFAAFPSTVMVPQFLAEGSLLIPEGASATDVEVELSPQGRDEPEYANHFVFCVNFEPGEVQRVHHGRIRCSVAPVFNRWSEDLKHGAWALRRENARLARVHLGKGGSAAASALAGLADREAQVAALRECCRVAQARVMELEATLAGMAAPAAVVGPAAVEPPESPAVTAISTAPAVLTSPGEDPNSWENRRRRAAGVLIPWIEQTVPLAGKTVLEYGCGNAAVSCAFAQRAGRVIGVDIDEHGIEEGREHVRERSHGNIELELHGLDSILAAVAARQGEIDVFLLYAVLEHLTVSERLAVMRLAREVVKPGGAIVVCETPNRLIYFDHHTAQMPFFHLLPDELALDCYQRSEREDFRAAIDTAAEQGPEAAPEAIRRWGRGVSFHEFEVVFGDLYKHVLASNYDPLLFSERPIQPDEVILARYLERWRPDLAPVWSRYWLDLILSPTPLVKRPPFLAPWSAQTVASTNVGWTSSERLHLSGPGATLWVELPRPTSRLVVGSVTREGGTLALSARPESSKEPLRGTAAAPPGQAVFTSFALPSPAHRIALSASRECELVFVGYED